MILCTKCRELKEEINFSSKHKQCKICLAKSTAEWRKKNPEYCKNYDRKRYSENSEKCKKQSKKYRQQHRFAMSLRYARIAANKNGHTPCIANTLQIETSFTGKCVICGVPECECRQTLHMDHDHNTGIFRGWLCENCNKGLGHFKDNPELLLKAIVYLENSLAVEREAF
jgi:hypothetical protein